MSPGTIFSAEMLVSVPLRKTNDLVEICLRNLSIALEAPYSWVTERTACQQDPTDDRGLVPVSDNGRDHGRKYQYQHKRILKLPREGSNGSHACAYRDDIFPEIT